MTLMFVNLSCSVIMALCGLLIVTGRRNRSRLVRLFCALIATGGTVNTLGMLAALCSIGNFAYGDIWPGEAVVNVGASALMAHWIWQMRKRPSPAS